MWQFFEPRTEYLTCREWHSEWHSACMRKPVSWHFVDVEHLLYREQVLGRENVNGQGVAGGFPSSSPVAASAARIFSIAMS